MFHRTLDGTAWNPSGTWHERRAPLVRLTDEDGVAGIGEGWCDQARIGAFFGHLRHVATGLLGQSVDDRAEDLPDWVAPSVASAIDMASWDLRARRAGRPLHAMLGSTGGTAPVYASGGLYRAGAGPDALAAEMRSYAALGFTAVKMKIGGLPLAGDMARVAAVRQALGPGAAIIVDAVEQLTVATAPPWLDGLAALGVAGIQAPLPADDVAGMALLQARGPLPVIAQEREFRPAAFHRLIERRAVGMVQVNPGLAGGITGALAVLAMARAAGLPATLQCHATAVLQAACLHLAAGRAGVHSAEYHRFHDHLHAALPPEMRTVRDGRLHLGAQPGLGIDPSLPEHAPGPGVITRAVLLPG